MVVAIWVDQMQLLWRNVVLDLHRTLADYRIQHWSTLTLVVHESANGVAVALMQ